MAREWGGAFSHQGKFSGHVARVTANQSYLLKPDTYVNESGVSVKAMAQFHRIQPSGIVVIHDDLDLEPGTVRLKMGGGHGGHNGLKDIINHLGTKDFWRIRLGIGHPGHKSKVTPFVLGAIPEGEQAAHQQAMARVLAQMDQMAAGNMARAQEALHQDGV